MYNRSVDGSKARLVDAMIDLMWERGYTAASPREVRERAGVGQGSMYHHFRGKRELALAALERNCATQVPLSVEPLTGEGLPMERLTRYLTVERDALRGCKVGRMTQDPGVVADPGLLAPVAAAFAAVRGALTGVLGEAIEAGELPAGLDASQVAAAVTSAIQGGYVLSIAAQDPQPLQDACRGALQLLRFAGASTPA